VAEAYWLLPCCNTAGKRHAGSSASQASERRRRAGRHHVDGKVLSLRNRLVLRDPDGRDVAQVQRKLVAMRPTYQISIADQEAAEIRKRLFTPFGDRFTIDVPGPDDLEMIGDLFDHEFTIRRGDQPVATVSKRWFSMRDTYAVDVAPGQDDLLILASVLALDLAQDEERQQH
jgi:uncharacterized protein YxjI